MTSLIGVYIYIYIYQKIIDTYEKGEKKKALLRGGNHSIVSLAICLLFGSFMIKLVLFQYWFHIYTIRNYWIKPTHCGLLCYLDDVSLSFSNSLFCILRTGPKALLGLYPYAVKFCFNCMVIGGMVYWCLLPIYISFTICILPITVVVSPGYGCDSLCCL